MFQKILSLITISAVVGIGAITLVAMVAHAGCFAQTVAGGSCSADVGTIQFFNFNSGVFQLFSLAIFIVFNLFCAVFAIIIGRPQKSILEYRTYRDALLSHTYARRKFFAWYACFELSPTQ